jgi:hypothetical protein
MTLMVLLGVYNLRQRGISLLPTSGMTLRSRSEKLGDGEKYKDRVNILLLVAALVATMTLLQVLQCPVALAALLQTLAWLFWSMTVTSQHLL